MSFKPRCRLIALSLLAVMACAIPAAASGYTLSDAVTAARNAAQENTAQNSAPTAQDLDLKTYRNVALTERFAATDPEGDLLTYQLVDKPARGSVTISEEEPGVFVYTPYENKTGKDSFTYVAIDANGNVSNEATVKIKIEKAKTKVTYADMAGHEAYNAAIRLAEEEILVGQCVGGVYYFEPEASMSRDQFLALAMSALELEPLEDVSATGFMDDEAIPTWSKGYVSSALRAGVIRGYSTDAGVVFKPQAIITRAEAAVILNRLLSVTDVPAETTWYPDSETAPAWALQSAVNLETAGVLRTSADGALALSETLTRGAAAQLLASALEVLEARDSGGFFG